MTTRRLTSSMSARPTRPWMDELADRVPGGSRNVKIGLGVLAGVILALIIAQIVTSQRVAQWASIEVVDSRDPLQDLPIRLASSDGTVRPAQTYDAILDLKSIDHLVVGVDLDYLPRPGTRREVVIRTGDGVEKFRDEVPGSYFTEGRFMLRLFSRQFPSGDYTLEIEAPEESGETRVVAASWFQVER
ncbi:MAG TPA: hypothetical protein VEC56_10135 [Candidatus Krumholzibacteria bacterium]|nr:hypothetical protein [Candidatus Krumholzibacteria bacterium]